MKLEEQMERKIKLQGLSPNTFRTYWGYCVDYMQHVRSYNASEWRHPKDCGRVEIERWLSWLSTDKGVSKSTQNTALQAVLYLYREILGISIENVSAMRAKREAHTREVLSVGEVGRLFTQLDGVNLLVAQLMYGCGLRIGDAVGLRLKDISFDRKQLAIKTTKGEKWRFTVFPEIVHQAVRRQIQSVEVVCRCDQTQNPNGVSLPDAYRRKSPRAASSLMWYFLFPSDCLSVGHERVLCRHHRHPDHIARMIKEASERAGIMKRVTSHVLRHSYATHSHEQGVPMRTLMQLLGHADIRTTEIYVHSDEHQATAALSPLETLMANPSTMQIHRRKRA